MPASAPSIPIILRAVHIPGPRGRLHDHRMHVHEIHRTLHQDPENIPHPFLPFLQGLSPVLIAPIQVSGHT